MWWLETRSVVDFNHGRDFAALQLTIAAVIRKNLRLPSLPRKLAHVLHLYTFGLYDPSRVNSEALVQKFRVIVADDNLPFLQKLTDLLSQEFEVTATAKDGKSVLDLVRRYRPDLVVLDIQMPALNGLEVTRQLVTFPSAPPVLICSVETDPEIVHAAREAGALAYVVKRRIERDLIPTAKSVLQERVFVASSPD